MTFELCVIFVYLELYSLENYLQSKTNFTFSFLACLTASFYVSLSACLSIQQFVCLSICMHAALLASLFVCVYPRVFFFWVHIYVFCMCTRFPVPRERAFITHKEERKNERKNLPQILTVLGGAGKNPNYIAVNRTPRSIFLTELLQPFHISNNSVYNEGVYNILGLLCLLFWAWLYSTVFRALITSVSGPNFFLAPALKQKIFAYHTRFHINHHRRR